MVKGSKVIDTIKMYLIWSALILGLSFPIYLIFSIKPSLMLDALKIVAPVAHEYSEATFGTPDELQKKLSMPIVKKVEK